MLDVVCLASGGLDSIVCLHLLRRQGLRALPVFVNYGQRNVESELASLKRNVQAENFIAPVIIDVSGFGLSIRTGLTDASMRVLEDAFTPNRNLLFLTLGASVAFTRGISKLVLGFLAERTAIFPDQTDKFLITAREVLSESLGVDISISCPLRDLSKKQVLLLAEKFGVASFYSCHAGGSEPCGACIACLEYK